MKDLLHSVFYLLVLALLSSVTGNIVGDMDHHDGEENLKILLAEVTGRLVAAWTEDLEVNPEELGHYFQGDIKIPTKLRTGLSAETAKWPGGVIPYEIKGTFNADEKNTIKKAINLFHKSTCLKFVPYTNQEFWVRITSDENGCWSNLGHIASKPQLMNLQRPGCLARIGTVLHELSHVAGILHEHTRPDRDKFVTIAFQNVADGQEHNFDKDDKKEVDDFGIAYDYGSVMHYSALAFSKNGKSTIIPKKKTEEIGQRTGFSKSDIKRINRMYKCPK